ncbi:MAG: hypothetical protein ACHQ2F_01065 [Desulfobaccales bacterium]
MEPSNFAFKMEKAERGKRLLADFLRTPAHLEGLRRFSEIWWPFRHRINGAALLDLISQGQFPEWFWKPQSHRIRLALKKMEKEVGVVKGRPPSYEPKAGVAALLLQARQGKRRLAEFFQPPAHLEVVRNFAKLWQPYREMLDGELLMNMIQKRFFPEWHWEAAKEEAAGEKSFAA